MKNAEKEALEIAVKITVAKAENSSPAGVLNGASGTEAGQFFQNLYTKVLQVTSRIPD